LGGSAVDSIIGGSGDDIISAGDGDDIIDGGAGADTLTGGGGDDTFVFTKTSNGVDTINDFVIADDILQFADSADLSLVGVSKLNFVIGEVATLKDGSNLIEATHNVIVLTDAVDKVDTALSTINTEANASVGNGVIVVAFTTGDDNAKVWYDYDAATDDTAVVLANLTGISVDDLASMTIDNFIVV